jgi:hypothetical protein
MSASEPRRAHALPVHDGDAGDAVLAEELPDLFEGRLRRTLITFVVMRSLTRTIPLLRSRTLRQSSRKGRHHRHPLVDGRRNGLHRGTPSV